MHERLEKHVRQRDAFFTTNEQFHYKLLEIAGNRWPTARSVAQPGQTFFSSSVAWSASARESSAM